MRVASDLTQRAKAASLRDAGATAARTLRHVFEAIRRDESIDFEEIGRTADAIVPSITRDGIKAWLDLIRKHHNGTYRHSLLVTGLVVAFADSLGAGKEEQRRMARAALLHDVGKAQIPLEILDKPGDLTAAELWCVRQHPVLGYSALINHSHCDAELLDVVRHHHEMLDGSGYPDGLKGSQISDIVRIVAVCDVYAALIERRAYKPPFPTAKAFQILQNMKGKLEDVLIDAFRPTAMAIP
ncbi:MAG: HD domain-containing protein [Pseudolabrys sp.]|nr:HD domain-containing protein [Pseudolabrys sp.]